VDLPNRGGSRPRGGLLDGQETPIRIEPGGQAASLIVSGMGRHEAVIRRVVPIESRDHLEIVSLPINPNPLARVRLSGAF